MQLFAHAYQIVQVKKTAYVISESSLCKFYTYLQIIVKFQHHYQLESKLMNNSYYRIIRTHYELCNTLLYF